MASGWEWDSQWFNEFVGHEDIKQNIKRDNWVPVGRLKKLIGKPDAALAIKNNWYAMRKGDRPGLV